MFEAGMGVLALRWVSSMVVAPTIDWRVACFDGTITTITTSTSPPRHISVTTGTCREVSGASGGLMGHMGGCFGDVVGIQFIRHHRSIALAF